MMKLRHAATLALVGWYLLLPPVDTQSGRVNPSAPLSDWVVFPDRFIHSREKCEDEQAGAGPTMDLWKDKVDKMSVEEKALMQQFYHARCVELSDDDPRVQRLGNYMQRVPDPSEPPAYPEKIPEIRPGSRNPLFPPSRTPPP